MTESEIDARECLDRVQSLLNEVQWDDNGGPICCPSCGSHKNVGHDKDCYLMQVLAEVGRVLDGKVIPNDRRFGRFRRWLHDESVREFNAGHGEAAQALSRACSEAVKLEK